MYTSDLQCRFLVCAQAILLENFLWDKILDGKPVYKAIVLLPQYRRLQFHQVARSLHRSEIEMKECVAYGEVAESEAAVCNDTEEGIYENP